MSEHAEVAQEDDEEDRSLELDRSPHTGVDIQEDFIKDEPKLLSA
jgi:hypothetical protein